VAVTEIRVPVHDRRQRADRGLRAEHAGMGESPRAR
jgi:hypothetical protein